MSFKIPSFISEHFNSLRPEEKKEAIDRYKRWHSHEFTEMLMQYLEDTHEALVKADEDKSDFLSKFQFDYVTIRNKAQRKVLKDLLKKMDYEV